MPPMEPAVLSCLRRVLQGGPPMSVAVVFGSFARGDARADSDFDIGIIPLDPSLPLRDELDLQIALGRAVGRTVDLVRLDLAPILLRWRVAIEGVPLAGRETGAWTHFVAETAAEHAEIAPALSRAAETFRRRLCLQHPP